MLKDRETPMRRRPLDRVGLALLVIWVGCLQVMLDKGNELDWFNSNFIVTLAVIVVVSFSLFLVWELTDAHPIVDLELFRHRNFGMSALALSLAYGAVPRHHGDPVAVAAADMGYTATGCRHGLAPVGIFAILLAPLVGRTVHSRPAPLRHHGVHHVRAVLFMRTHFNTSADFATLMVPTLIQGVAMAMFFIPLVTISLSGLSPDRIPAASGLFNFARITAGSFGTSIATTLWDRRASLHHAQLAEHITPYDPASTQALSHMQAGGMSQQQSYEMLNRMIDQQAFMLSANDIFYVSALLFLLLIGVIWLARPVRGDVVAGGGGERALMNLAAPGAAGDYVSCGSQPRFSSSSGSIAGRSPLA